jgi:hypothetical protein
MFEPCKCKMQSVRIRNYILLRIVRIHRDLSRRYRDLSFLLYKIVVNLLSLLVS